MDETFENANADQNSDESADEVIEEAAVRDAVNRRRLQFNRNVVREAKEKTDRVNTTDLRNLAQELHDEVARRINDPKFVHKREEGGQKLVGDSKADTIAVGLKSDGTLIISANVKERRETPGGGKKKYIKLETNEGKKAKGTFENFGMTKEVIDAAEPVVKNSPLYKEGGLKVKFVEEKVNPKQKPGLDGPLEQAKDHQAKHAEMKIKAHCDADGEQLLKVGVSKPPCKGCHEELNEAKVKTDPADAGTKRVTSRGSVTKDDVKVVKKIPEKSTVKVTVQGLEVHENLDFSSRALKKNVKANVKNAFKPGASVGLISGISDLTETLKNGEVEPFAYQEVVEAHAGCSSRRLFGEEVGKVAHASASVYEARTGVGNLASVGISALSANAYAEVGLTNAVGVGATVARAHGNLGPVQVGAGLSFDTHASIGVNGVSASVAGIGFSIGPRIGIRTPFFDFSVTLF